MLLLFVILCLCFVHKLILGSFFVCLDFDINKEKERASYNKTFYLQEEFF